MNRYADSVRNFFHEWTLNILILLFGTTTLVQAFIVPTPSMDTTVMVGDHLLVDKLSYAPPGSLSRYLLPYTEPKRGDIIVFRYPMDISQNYVKRVMGVPDPTRENTSPDGKASSVQFLRFPFTAAQVKAFKTPGTQVLVGIDHENYGHIAVMPERVRAALEKDFA